MHEDGRQLGRQPMRARHLTAFPTDAIIDATIKAQLQAPEEAEADAARASGHLPARAPSRRCSTSWRLRIPADCVHCQLSCLILCWSCATGLQPCESCIGKMLQMHGKPAGSQGARPPFTCSCPAASTNMRATAPQQLYALDRGFTYSHTQQCINAALHG